MLTLKAEKISQEVEAKDKKKKSWQKEEKGKKDCITGQIEKTTIQIIVITKPGS